MSRYDASIWERDSRWDDAEVLPEGEDREGRHLNFVNTAADLRKEEHSLQRIPNRQLLNLERMD